MRDFNSPMVINSNFLRKSLECHLLDPMVWIIFIYVRRVNFHPPPGNRTRVPVTAIRAVWLPCEGRTPLTYVNALNILLKDLNLHLCSCV